MPCISFLRRHHVVMIILSLLIPLKAVPHGNSGANFSGSFMIGYISPASFTKKSQIYSFASLACHITLSDGGNPAGSLIRLQYLDPPYPVYEQVAGDQGDVLFDLLTPGNYLLEVSRSGYENYSDTTEVIDDTSVYVVLPELRYEPARLQVDDLSLVAEWEAPRDILVKEDFEGATFPPEGWLALSQGGTGWHSTDSDSISGFEIPDHTVYAVVSHDPDGGNGCCDYLVLPQVDLTNRPDYQLNFSSFYPGAYGQIVTVEISLDQGLTWIPLLTLSPSPLGWTDNEVDLAEYSGAGGAANALIAFHTDDSGNQGSGLAIDDVSLCSGFIPVLGYGVYLDGLLLGYTPYQTYQYSLLLNYGQDYTAGVSALYSSGYSDQDTCLFMSRFLFPAMNLQVNIPEYNDYVHLWWDCPVYQPDTGYLIGGLTGYNIYRDDAFIAYVEKPVLEYFDPNLMPGTYSYHITAVYDLTHYGFAGQTGESMIEGPVDGTISYGYELPFTENFNSGLFETNQWTVDGGNWRIAGQVGNDAPSVEFYYYPAINEYSQSLTSFYMIGSGIIDGRIMMDFDLKHTLVNPTEEEFLAVEVSNGGAWVKVGEFKNTNNIDWTTETVDLTGIAKGNVFRVRFTAYGANTLDIFNWLIDNIRVYRECHQPLNFLCRIDFPDHNDVILTWEAPTGGGGGVSAWLGWDDGTNSDAIGLTNGGTFNVAVRFTPAHLAQYAGTSLTRIRLFPYATGGNIELKVWTGANAGNLMLTQPVASYTAGVWNEFALNTPVVVTGATELWFGYTVTHAAGQFVAGCDAGPAADGFGDMISLDGSVWESMSTAYGLDYNWNLNGYVESVDGVTELQPIAANTVFGPVSKLVRGNLPMLPGAAVNGITARAGRELVGYNIWRDDALIGSTTETTYTDPDMDPGWYCYTVSAVYQDCESGVVDDDCVLIRNVSYTGMEALRLYPNPAGDVVYFDFNDNSGVFLLHDQTGHLVFRTKIETADVFHMNVSVYTAGNYLVTFISGTGEILSGWFSVIR